MKQCDAIIPSVNSFTELSTGSADIASMPTCLPLMLTGEELTNV